MFLLLFFICWTFFQFSDLKIAEVGTTIFPNLSSKEKTSNTNKQNPTKQIQKQTKPKQNQNKTTKQTPWNKLKIVKNRDDEWNLSRCNKVKGLPLSDNLLGILQLTMLPGDQEGYICFRHNMISFAEASKQNKKITVTHFSVGTFTSPFAAVSYVPLPTMSFPPSLFFVYCHLFHLKWFLLPFDGQFHLSLPLTVSLSQTPIISCSSNISIIITNDTIWEKSNDWK